MTFLPGQEHVMYRHGHCTAGRTGAYRSWCNMKSRCYDPANDNFEVYGGRGIRVCEEWHDFVAFHAYMGDRPSGRTLDRRDPDGDYEPGNCRWATARQQAGNKRQSILVEFEGTEILLRDLARRFDVPATTIYRRYKQGVRGADLVDATNRNVFRTGGKCPTAKLTDEQAAEIRLRLAKGERQATLAKAFGVAQSVISQINRGKAYAPRTTN